MTTSLRISAVLLGLLGVERIVYADIISVLPGMAQPTPPVNLAMGLSVLIAAVASSWASGGHAGPACLGRL